MSTDSKADINEFPVEHRDSQLAMALTLLAKSIDEQAHKRYFKASQDYAALYEQEVEDSDDQLVKMLSAIRSFDTGAASYLHRKITPVMSMDAFKGFVLIVAGTLRSEKAVQNPFNESWLLLQMFENSRFHENLLSNHFKETEGLACSVDKASTVLRALCKGAVFGEYPTFNYDAEYTFHLPKRSLNTPDSIKLWGNLACRAASGDIMPLATFKQALTSASDSMPKESQ